MIILDSNVQAAMRAREEREDIFRQLAEKKRRLAPRLAALRASQRGFVFMPGGLGAAKPPGGGGGATDPNYANVSLLLHMNGTNGSTTFTDNSPSPRTMTANGNAQISTAQSVFGGAAGLFDGSGDYVDTPSNAVFNMGSGAFAAESWARFSALGSFSAILGQTDSGVNASATGILLRKTDTNKVQGLCGSGGSLVGTITGSTSLSANVWYHIAYVRNGNNFNIYLDGFSDATTVTSSATLNSSSNKFAVGRMGEFNGQYMNGYLDDVRVTKGVARYTANFTPPSAQFPDS